MRVQKGKVRAPQPGRVWPNLPPLHFRQGRRRGVDFGHSAVPAAVLSRP